MNGQKSRLSNEIRIIPAWAYLLALGLFTGLQIVLSLVWNAKIAPPLPVQIFIRVVPAALLLVLGLLIGYVNLDAKRRGMNRTLWTLLVIFIPNAIGFILYFLLRKPVATACPQCGTLNNPEFNFCPKCKYNLRPTCPGCQHSVSLEDAFCPYCSRDLAPERVHAGS
jgi:RNA polymerase subunit RPABC4/transcription elongation factor Spt4